MYIDLFGSDIHAWSKSKKRRFIGKVNSFKQNIQIFLKKMQCQGKMAHLFCSTAMKVILGKNWLLRRGLKSI
jgi:hypothetical protein